MSACAHRKDPFHKLSKQECIDAATEMIGHITTHARFGIFTSVSEALVLKAAKHPVDPFASAYTLLCWLCLLGIKQWADETQFGGDIAYFFETGSPYQKQANALMDDLFKIPEERAAFRYATHSFVDKEKVRPIQSPDMLAWHAVTDHRRRSQGQGKRADFSALLKCETFARHVDDEQLLGFRSWWLNRSPEENEHFAWGRRMFGRSRNKGG